MPVSDEYRWKAQRIKYTYGTKAFVARHRIGLFGVGYFLVVVTGSLIYTKYFPERYQRSQARIERFFGFAGTYRDTVGELVIEPKVRLIEQYNREKAEEEGTIYRKPEKLVLAPLPAPVPQVDKTVVK